LVFDNLHKMGDKGGKSDMDRMGIFQEMKYHTIGDKYTTPGGKYL